MLFLRNLSNLVIASSAGRATWRKPRPGPAGIAARMSLSTRLMFPWFSSIATWNHSGGAETMLVEAWSRNNGTFCRRAMMCFMRSGLGRVLQHKGSEQRVAQGLDIRLRAVHRSVDFVQIEQGERDLVLHDRRDPSGLRRSVSPALTGSAGPSSFRKTCVALPGWPGLLSSSISSSFCPS